MIPSIILESVGPVSGGVRTTRDDESSDGRDSESKKSERDDLEHG
jgi:hypothetical protein